LTDDFKEIVIEEASEDPDWDNFREKLVTAQQKNKAVCSNIFTRTSNLMNYQGKLGKGPRFAVYDFSYELASGEGTRYALRKLSTPNPVLTFIQKQDHIYCVVSR